MANTSNIIFFRTIQKTNVVFLKNKSKRKILHKSGEKKGKVKQMQPIMYCKDHDTIVTEEILKLDPKAKPTPLMTKKGTFRVTEDDVHLLEYLRASEENEANGGKLFKEINVAKEELYQIEGFKAYDKSLRLVMDASENETLALGIEFLNPAAINYSASKIKLDLRRKLSGSDKLVNEVLSFMEDKVSEEKLTIAIALKEGIIELHQGKKFVWSEGAKEQFYLASQSGDAVSELALWMKNDAEGRQYLKSISDKLTPQ